MDILELNRQAWNRIGATLESPYVEHPIYRAFFERFCSLLPESGRVLDLGCGPGVPLARQMVSKGLAVTGVDISDTMVDVARRNVPGASFHRMSMTDIQYVDEFDGIVSGHSMLCLDPVRFRIAAAKIVSALRSQGWFFLALNEPRPPDVEEHAAEETSDPPPPPAEPLPADSEAGLVLHTLFGELMYSSPYPESEVRAVFSAAGMNVTNAERLQVVSRVLGTEYALVMLMQKQ